MYLINAIYFKSPMPDVLSRVFALPHLYTAELSYGNDAFGMTVLLPERGANVDSVAAALTTDQWNEITAMLDGSLGTTLGVSLPKFSHVRAHAQRRSRGIGDGHRLRRRG